MREFIEDNGMTRSERHAMIEAMVQEFRAAQWDAETAQPPRMLSPEATQPGASRNEAEQPTKDGGE